MTRNEALIFFPLSKYEDLEDLYEERLFDYKSFFLNKPIIRNTFEAKKNKMLQMHMAYLILGEKEQEKENTSFSPFINFQFSEEILPAFQQFQLQHNLLKWKLQAATSAIEIKLIVDQIIQLHDRYCLLWPHIPPFPDDLVVVSKEPDPMTLLKSIREFNELGGIFFSDLIHKRNILPELLLNETKRLSLYRKLEKNG
jgi:hypothetical protein